MISVTLTSYLTILLSLLAPVWLLVRYVRKPAGERPGKATVAGIVTCTVLMSAALVYMMSMRIFF
jgi:positive regulator of sigma E activity